MVLTVDEEKLLEQQALALQYHNFPVARPILIEMGNKILARRQGHLLRDAPLLGEGWYRSFMSRHSILSIRTPEILPADRAAASTEAALIPHINCLQAVLEHHNLWHEPTRIWNADETGLKLGEGGRTRVIARRGTRQVHAKAPSDTRHVSVIFAVSASGQHSPPTFILPCGRTPPEFWQAIKKLQQPQWATVCEKKGFITEVSFLQWLKLFVLWLRFSGRPLRRRQRLSIDSCRSRSGAAF